MSGSARRRINVILKRAARRRLIKILSGAIFEALGKEGTPRPTAVPGEKLIEKKKV